MFRFRELANDDCILDGSPLVRALDYLTQKFVDHPNGIPLTKGSAFKRDLVADAISIINWPDWTEAEIYNGFMPIKVADEQHFEPFWELHHLLVHNRLARHYKGKLVLTKQGTALFKDRFKRFHQVTQDILFHDQRLIDLHHRRGLVGTWDIWLNVIDLVAVHGASGRELTDALYGQEEQPHEFDPRTSALYDGVLKPLMRCGLLEESRANGRKLIERVYSRTPLWTRYLKLDPKEVIPRVIH